MMHHHEPCIADALEDVGGEHVRALRAVVAALCEIFLDDDDRQVAANHHLDLAELELHLEHVVEDTLPTRHDRAPSRKFAPSGMDANDARVFQPDRFHLFCARAAPDAWNLIASSSSAAILRAASAIGMPPR